MNAAKGFSNGWWGCWIKHHPDDQKLGRCLDGDFGGNSDSIFSRIMACSALCSGVRYLALVRSKAANCSGVGLLGGFSIGSSLCGFVHFISCDRCQDSETAVYVEFENDDDEFSGICPSECNSIPGGSTYSYFRTTIVQDTFNFVGGQSMFRNMLHISARFGVPIDEVKSDHTEIWVDVMCFNPNDSHSFHPIQMFRDWSSLWIRSRFGMNPNPCGFGIKPCGFGNGKS